ncbi:MAG: c-type cytochrome [Hyphomonadaceae bacterium]|nr:c-type cytochrome [Hyphomonadaceae bacterium]
MRIAFSALSLFALAACGEQAAPTGAAPGTPSAPAPGAEAMQQRIAALPAPYNDATYEAGRRAFAQCRSCHTINAGGGHRAGPNLHGLIGREIGSAPDFSYSQAAQNANFTWTPEQLDRWLQEPRTFLPGNRMAFAGVRDAAQRRDLIAYLMVETAAD